MTTVAAGRSSSPALRWATILAVVVAAVAAYLLLFPSEEGKVRKRVGALADAVSIPAGEGDIPRLARAQRLRRQLANGLTVHFEDGQWPPIVGRDGVAALVARPWPGTAEGVSVEVHDLGVRVESETADARFRVRVVTADTASDPATLDGRMIALTMQKVDGEWLVSSARIMGSDDAER